MAAGASPRPARLLVWLLEGAEGLHLDELAIVAARAAQQLGVRARFEDVAVLEDEDPVDLADRREALEVMAAEIQAGSLEGAMVQIMLAHAEADLMAASTEESSEAQMRTIAKLLYSALAAIEQVAGVPREELGGEAYLTRKLDPNALVAEAETEGTA